MTLKKGDIVASQRLDMAGTVQDVSPCTGPDCDKTSLTLDPPEKMNQFYYHAEDFEVIHHVE